MLVDWLVRLAIWLFIVGGYWCWQWRWWLVAGLLIAVTAGVAGVRFLGGGAPLDGYAWG